MYHHFKGDNLSRSEYIQSYVVERILQSSIQDVDRESSKVWELKHSSSCLQVGRLLALKRGLSLELAEIICVLHDIAVIETGSYIDHAKKGSDIAKKILEETRRFKAEEIELICKAIAHHSEKEIYSDDPYVELVKDADVYDCSLYEGTVSYYKAHKSAGVCAHYGKRVQQVSEALGLPVRPDFKL